MTRSRPPHLVLITTDQQRADTVVGQAANRVETPHLDRLASQGATYPQATTPCPVCMAARTSLLTGQYASTHRTLSNHHQGGRVEPNLPGMFRAAGYRTALVGKNHTFATANDWDVFDTTARSGPDRSTWQSRYAGSGWPRLATEPVPGGIEQTPDAAWTTRAIELLDQTQADDRPLLLWLSLHSPHTPYVAPDPYFTRYSEADLPPRVDPSASLNRRPFRDRFHRANDQALLPFDDERVERMRRVYLSMVTMADVLVGRVLDALNRLGISDQTFVIFTSDHGDHQGDHGLMTKHPSLAETLIRVPMIARFPGTLRAGVTDDRHASLVDLLATFADAARLPLPAESQGESLLQSPRRQAGFAEYGLPGLPSSTPDLLHIPQRNPNRDELPWEGNPVSLAGPLRMIRTAEWKLIHEPGGQDQLYHLTDDPDERRNLADLPDHRDRRARLSAELHTWHTSLTHR